jgi:hypothetical protein
MPQAAMPQMLQVLQVLQVLETADDHGSEVFPECQPRGGQDADEARKYPPRS